MKWSLLELKKFQNEPVVIDETLELNAHLKEREPQILEISPVVVKGLLTVGKDEYILHYTADYTITLPSTRSLTPVPLKLSIPVTEVFMTEEQFSSQDDPNFQPEQVMVIEGQTIILDESVEDNILLEIPIQVLSEEEQQSEDYPSGSEWEVMSEEEYAKRLTAEKEETVDPRFAGLANLFGDEDAKE
jgi:uncharacterized protein